MNSPHPEAPTASTTNRHYGPRRGVLWQELDGEVVILDSLRGLYFTLDRVGTDLWQRLVGGSGTREIFDALAGIYEVPRERLRGDLERLIRDLEGQELIECRD